MSTLPHPVNCPACGASVSEALYTVRNIPVHSCVLLDSAEEARKFPRRDLELAFCEGCGFVFNHLFDEEAMGYSTNFEESQHFSGTFNAFARELALEIAEKCATPGKRVVEIGCGKGEFLRGLVEVGACTGIGIDPGYRPDRLEKDERLEFHQEFFGPQHYDLGAEVVLCRHTLEHIPDVQSFVAKIRANISDDPSIWVMFETPDAERVLREGAFWDIYNEHCSYFSAGTHGRLFRQEGFEVTDLYLAYDQQYIIQYASPAEGRTGPRLPIENDLAEMRRLASHFPQQVRNMQEKWRDLVKARAARGERVVLWGGSSKGVSFLTTLGLQDEVDCVVDVNPYKQGKFVPGTGHEVVAPEALVERVPSLVIVMNPIYCKEIGASLEKMGLHPEIVAV